MGLSLVGNLISSVGFAALVHGVGTLDSGGDQLVASIVDNKSATHGLQLFWRAVLCNLLVLARRLPPRGQPVEATQPVPEPVAVPVAALISDGVVATPAVESA